MTMRNKAPTTVLLLLVLVPLMIVLWMKGEVRPWGRVVRWPLKETKLSFPWKRLTVGQDSRTGMWALVQV